MNTKATQHIGFQFFLVALILIGFSQSTLAQFRPPVGVEFYIQAAEAFETGKDIGFWDVPGSNLEYRKGQNIQVWRMDNGADRKFLLYPDRKREGYYYILPVHASKSGGRLDVAGGIKGNGTNIQLWDANGSTSQSFRFQQLPNGNFKIFSHNGMALCLAGRSYANGSNVHTWSDHDGHWMEWVLIKASDGFAIANGLKAPQGRITVPNGYSLQDVEVFYYTNKYSKSPLVTKPNERGDFSFPNAEISDKDYVAVLLIVAEGLVSEHYRYHKTQRVGNQTFNLKEAPAGTKLVKTFNRGSIPFKKGSKHWENTLGEINRQDDFFFRNITKNTPEKKQLCEIIGVSGADATTDEEIYQIAKKTWDFYKTNTKSGMGNVPEDVKKAFDESMNRSRPNGPVTYWTTVEQFVQLYNKYGFMPVGNCSSQALAMAAFLRVAGIPADKMAVERMNYDFYRDHWAVIIEMNDIWYWFDPTYSRSNFPDFISLQSIPKSRKGFNYDLPYEIIPLPGSSLNYVPYCGKEGMVGM